MSRPLRILIPGGFYHVTCRGNDRRAIFKDDRDRTVQSKIRVKSLSMI